MAIKRVGSNADGYRGSRTPRDPLKAPQKTQNGPKVGKKGKNQFFSVLKYLEVVLAHHSLPSGIGRLSQVGNGGLGPLGAPKETPRGSRWPKSGYIR